MSKKFKQQFQILKRRSTVVPNTTKLNSRKKQKFKVVPNTTKKLKVVTNTTERSKTKTKKTAQTAGNQENRYQPKMTQTTKNKNVKPLDQQINYIKHYNYQSQQNECALSDTCVAMDDGSSCNLVGGITWGNVNPVIAATCSKRDMDPQFRKRKSNMRFTFGNDGSGAADKEVEHTLPVMDVHGKPVKYTVNVHVLPSSTTPYLVGNDFHSHHSTTIHHGPFPWINISRAREGTTTIGLKYDGRLYWMPVDGTAAWTFENMQDATITYFGNAMHTSHQVFADVVVQHGDLAICLANLQEPEVAHEIRKQLANIRRHRHEKIKSSQRSTGVLSIDLSGPHILGWWSSIKPNMAYFLQAVHTREDFQRIPYARPLTSRHAQPLVQAVMEIVNEIQHGHKDIQTTRVHSDCERGLLGASSMLESVGLRWTNTGGYQPQGNGAAERSIGLSKEGSRFIMTNPRVSQRWWPHTVMYVNFVRRQELTQPDKKHKIPGFYEKIVARIRQPLGNKSGFKPHGKLVRFLSPCQTVRPIGAWVYDEAEKKIELISDFKIVPQENDDKNNTKEDNSDPFEIREEQRTRITTRDLDDGSSSDSDAGMGTQKESDSEMDLQSAGENSDDAVSEGDQEMAEPPEPHSPPKNNNNNDDVQMEEESPPKKETPPKQEKARDAYMKPAAPQIAVPKNIKRSREIPVPQTPPGAQQEDTMRRHIEYESGRKQKTAAPDQPVKRRPIRQRNPVRRLMLDGSNAKSYDEETARPVGKRARILPSDHPSIIEQRINLPDPEEEETVLIDAAESEDSELERLSEVSYDFSEEERVQTKDQEIEVEPLFNLMGQHYNPVDTPCVSQRLKNKILAAWESNPANWPELLRREHQESERIYASIEKSPDPKSRGKSAHKLLNKLSFIAELESTQTTAVEVKPKDTVGPKWLESKREEICGFRDRGSLKVVNRADRVKNSVTLNWYFRFHVKATKNRHKTRGCLLGDQEIKRDPRRAEVPSASPTASRTSTFSLRALATQEGQPGILGDVPQAFLRSRPEIWQQRWDRFPVYCEPFPDCIPQEVIPPELRLDPKTQCYQCCGAIYGLQDAPYIWFRSLKANVADWNEQSGHEVKLIQSKIDPCVYWAMTNKGGVRQGVGGFALHVDDVEGYGFTKEARVALRDFLISQGVPPEKIEITDQPGGARSCGRNVTFIKGNKNKPHQTIIDMDHYSGSLIDLSLEGRDPKEKLTPRDVSNVQKSIGIIAWLACSAGAEYSQVCSAYLSELPTATLEIFHRINKINSEIREHGVRIVMTALDTQHLSLLTFHDSSFAGASSQGARAHGLIPEKVADQYMNGSLQTKAGRTRLSNRPSTQQQWIPIDWSSSRVRRVVRSTFAAEACQASQTADHVHVLRRFFAEGGHPFRGPSPCIGDCASVTTAIETYKTVCSTDRRTAIELGVVREMAEQRELMSLWWPTTHMMVDGCTKDSRPLRVPVRDAFQKGVFKVPSPV